MKIIIIILTFFIMNDVKSQTDTSNLINIEISNIGNKILKNACEYQKYNFDRLKVYLRYYIADSSRKEDSVFFKSDDTTNFKPIYICFHAYSGIKSQNDTNIFIEFIKEFDNNVHVKKLFHNLINSRIWMLNSKDYRNLDRFRFVFISIKN